jgi:uncharacterized protein (DUF1499 family)
MATRPPGVVRGKLAPCPRSPNSVSTESEDAAHLIDPIPFTTSTAEARGRMLAILRSMPRTTIVTQREDYLHAEFRSAIFRFVDDVEVYFDAPAKHIQLRSASRLGYSDLGVNRRRVEEIRRRFLAAGS